MVGPPVDIRCNTAGTREIPGPMGQTAVVRLTDFWERMETVLGPDYAHSWARDVVLSDLGCTVEDAIARGVETKEVWRAVCASTEVPGTLR
jgi:hypothetical protein